MKYYIFNFVAPINGNSTVIFDCWNTRSDQLIEDLREFHTYNEQCNTTYYVYPSSSENPEDVKQTIGEYSNKGPSSIELLPYDINGLRIHAKSNLIAEVLKFGILNIAKKRSAVLESDETFHYVLPSDKHSPFFIRTGNILVNSEEINFIALALLTKVDVGKLTSIACDTSSILQIPYAINYLLGLFGERIEVSYKSFGSYGRLDEFYFKPGTLVLISASNSGDLEEKIRKYEKDLTFVTVLFNNPEGAKYNHLLNLSPFFNQILNGKDKKQFRHSHGCDYCDGNSIPVVVRGEQFIPSRLLIQRVLLTKWHVPSWIKQHGGLIIGNNSIRIFKRENTNSKRREVFIDLEALIPADTKFSKEFMKYVSNYIPASINQIIYIKDKASEAIARKIQLFFTEILSRKLPEPVPHNLVSTLKKSTEYCMLVVSACTTTGNKLNSISRDLRDFEMCSIHYLSAIARLENSDKTDTLSRNLEYKSEKSAYVYKYHRVISCFLGDFHDALYTEFEQPPWLSERNFWKKGELKEEWISNRIADLEDEAGLTDNLFLLNPFAPQEPLTLRKNFAFYTPQNGIELNQADVYFIVSSVFHYLRNPKYIDVDKKAENEKFLVQHEHVRTILDPECFKRYNDGVIQASLLRCARKSELHYAVSERDSLAMLETLKDIFRDPNQTLANEAIMEFLYAIAIGKLTLQQHHKSDFLDYIKTNFKENNYVFQLAEVAEKT